MLVTAEPEIGGAHPGGPDLDLTALPETLTNSDTVVHYVDYQFTPPATLRSGTTKAMWKVSGSVRNFLS